MQNNIYSSFLNLSVLIILLLNLNCFIAFKKNQIEEIKPNNFKKKIDKAVVNLQYIEKEIWGFKHPEGLSYSLDGGNLVTYKYHINEELLKSGLFEKIDLFVFDEEKNINEKYYMSIYLKEESNKPFSNTILSILTAMIIPLKKEKNIFFKFIMKKENIKICESNESMKLNSYFSPYLLFFNLLYLDANVIADFFKLSLKKSLEKCYEKL